MNYLLQMHAPTDLTHNFILFCTYFYAVLYDLFVLLKYLRIVCFEPARYSGTGVQKYTVNSDQKVTVPLSEIVRA